MLIFVVEGLFTAFLLDPFIYNRIISFHIQNYIELHMSITYIHVFREIFSLKYNKDRNISLRCRLECLIIHKYSLYILGCLEKYLC